MIDYKKIVKNPVTRARVLGILRFIPSEMMLPLQYWLKLGRKLNLKNPKRFTEKIQWYKCYYHDPLIRKCVDKYEVRKYVEECGEKKTLVKLLGIYDDPEQIDFERLPERFVMKKTNGGGGLNVILCRDRNTINISQLKELLTEWVTPPKKKMGGGREWGYGNIKARIIVEEYLDNKENPEAGINDYKIFCYNGKAKYIIVDVDRFVKHKRDFYDINWNNLHILSDCPAADREIPRPDNLNEMLLIAEKLSSKFPYVRVDLYNVDGRIYFGELTFYPWSGYVQFYPDQWDFKFGEDFELKKYRD